jgi:hypothetical protein
MVGMGKAPGLQPCRCMYVPSHPCAITYTQYHDCMQASQWAPPVKQAVGHGAITSMTTLKVA